MKIQTAALVALLAAPLCASAEPLNTTDQTQAVCAQAATLFAAGQYDQAYQSLVPHWPLPEEEILNLGYQTKTQLGMVASRFGPSLGAEHVESVMAGKSLVRHTFLIKHQRHALRFACVFYKPADAWLVNFIIWDDKPQALLEIGA